MPISTRGLGMATNATQNLAQFMAALGAQKAQGIRGLGDTARQIQQDAARRQMAQAAQDQRQQQIDMQQAQMLNAQMADSRQQRQQEEQRAALQQHLQGLQPQGQQLPGNLPTSALDAMMANLHAQQMQAGQQAFRGEQAGLDRGLSRDLATQREEGMLKRQSLGFGHERGMQDARLGHAASEGQKDRDSSLHRVKLNIFNQSAENERGRMARAAENAKDRASAKEIAGMRIPAAGKKEADPFKSLDSGISSLRKRIAQLQDQFNKTGKDALGEEAPPNTEARSQIKSTLDTETERLTDMLTQKFQMLKDAGEPIPLDLANELDRLLK